MNTPELKEEIRHALFQKWDGLVAEGHTLKVEFNILKDPEDESKTLAIDIAQNIDGEWHVQTVQSQVQEAYPVIGIEGVALDQLINLAGDVVDSVTGPLNSQRNDDDEIHLFVNLISPETSEIHGHIISKTGEKIGVRTNYQHYYVINEMLEQISRTTKEENVEIELQRSQADFGRIFIRFVHA